MKFYTKQGNWDLVGNNIPVFFIQDAIKFPDLIHAAKPEPDRGFPQAQTAHDNFWDFISLSPESMHMIMWIMSDRTIPRSFRFMEGFGVHTFRLVNAEGKSTFVKFHWKPKQGLQSVVWNEAVKINGADPDFHRRDLWDAIEAGDYPGMGARPPALRRGVRREVRLRRARRDQDHPRGGGAGAARRPAGPRPPRRQLLRRDRAGRLLHAEHRARDRLQQRPAAAGAELLLPRHPAQAARRPELHPHPDQRAEVPVRALPAGRPHGDAQPQGAGQLRAELLGATGGPRESPDDGLPVLSRAEMEGPKLRVRSETFADHYSQARQFYISQTEIEQAHIANALTFELSKVETPAIRARMVSHLLNIDAGLAETVATGLRLKEMPKPATAARPTRQDLKPSPKLSIIKNGPKSFAGRKVGALVTDGVDADVLAALGKALKAEGAMLKLVAPRSAASKDSATGPGIDADEKLEGGPVRPLRRRRDPALQGRGGAAGHSSPPPATSSPTPPRTGSSSPTSAAAAPLLEKAGVPAPRRGLRPPASPPATATASSPPAASCGFGSAKPWSSASRKRAGGRLPAQ